MRSLWLFAVAVTACGTPMSSADSGNPPTPDAGDTTMSTGVWSLDAGQVIEVTVSDLGLGGVMLATPTGTEQFIVVLASEELTTLNATHQYSLAIDPSTNPTGATSVDGCALSSSPWSTTVVPVQTPPSGTAVAVGTLKTLDVPTATGYEAVPMQAIRVSDSTVVWQDVSATHPANLDGGFVDAFLSDFEQKILPRERRIFGNESDQDGDGHISLVFSSLTYQTAVAFFTQCDLQTTAGCASSNHGEYLYLTPPDAIAPPYNTADAMKEILAHECSHLIHFNRKVLLGGLSSWPDSSYMIEGVGGFAQDAVGPQAGNLYVAVAGLNGIDQFSLSSTLIDGTVYDRTRDGVLRGVSYLFVRYLYDRGGGDHEEADGSITNTGGPAFLDALLQSKLSMAAALPTLSNAHIEDIAMDFYTTLAMSNRDENGGVKPSNSCFEYLPAYMDPTWGRQRGADVFASFFGMQMMGPATQDISKPDGKLRAGGVEYIVVNATPGQTTLGLTLLVDTPALARLRIGRLK